MSLYIRQKVRAFCAFLTILILLPYVAAVFANGRTTGGEEDDDAFFVTVRPPGRKHQTVMRWETYLTGILAREIPETFEKEALKAQAVLIRTKLYKELDEEREDVFTEEYLTTEEMERKWESEDYAACYEKYTAAVKETEDMVLMYEDTYAWTPYHQSSRGMTRSGEEVLGSEEYPYIAVKECPLDLEAEAEIQTCVLSYHEIQRLCQDFLVAETEKEKAESGYDFQDFEILSLDSGGYVSELRISETICRGDQFREALSLPSGAFSFQEAEDGLRITTTGKGHGLGMSQWTANEMAKEGKDYREILSFFFEGTELSEEPPDLE